MSIDITQNDVDHARQVLRDLKEGARVLRSDMDRLLAFERWVCLSTLFKLKCSY